MAYKLIVSDELQFTVHFTLADGDTDRAFAARLAARRCPGADLDTRLATPGLKVADFLAQQGLRHIAWVGDCPLVDDAGAPPPASAATLAVLMGIPNWPNLVMGEYLAANGARGKLGN